MLYNHTVITVHEHRLTLENQVF